MLDAEIFNQDTPLADYLSQSWRVVESQENVATLTIVDTMEEQGVLEALLDEVKPRYRTGTEGLHYLIKTAFRYPPLKYGSRFGTRAMPSFFYASEHLLTAFAETAYYRFLFFKHINVEYDQPVDSKHTAFSVTLRSNACLDLCSANFASLNTELVDKFDYSLCQAIGDWAVNTRKANLIRFPSARVSQTIQMSSAQLHRLANLAVISPEVIRSKRPESQETWLCRTTNKRISFSCRSADAPLIFRLDDFCVNGVLPRVS